LNLAYLCHMVLQPLRDRFGPIRINSGYRCPELNGAVGGVKNSQHMRGEAADIHLPSVEKGQEYLAFLKTLPAVDQLIWEEEKGTIWIHVSAKRLAGNRREIKPLSNEHLKTMKHTQPSPIADPSIPPIGE